MKYLMNNVVPPRLPCCFHSTTTSATIQRFGAIQQNTSHAAP